MPLLVFKSEASGSNVPTIWALQGDGEVTLYKLHDFERICWDREKLVQLRDLLSDTLRETG